jgi:hypothetical protein
MRDDTMQDERITAGREWVRLVKQIIAVEERLQELDDIVNRRWLALKFKSERSSKPRGWHAHPERWGPSGPPGWHDRADPDEPADEPPADEPPTPEAPAPDDDLGPEPIGATSERSEWRKKYLERAQRHDAKEPK